MKCPSSLPAEDDYGHIEYKLKLVDSTEQKLIKLATQMTFRINEGYGKAKYIIGVRDNGILPGISLQELDKSISTLQKVTCMIDAEISHINLYEIKNSKFFSIIYIVGEPSYFGDLFSIGL